MEFRLLGPLRVTVAGEDVAVNRPKLRLLLAVLLARANRLVPVDFLVEEMWGARPPGSAQANLRTYVWFLRRLLSPAAPMEAPVSTDPRGYLIDVPAEGLDLLIFERLVTEGVGARRHGDVEGAVARLENALALWRGSAFQNVSGPGNVLVTAARGLEEQRLTAVEELIDGRLDLGRHTETIGELQNWTARHPLRERLWEQLMLALYRDGRQAEALATYQRVRHLLVDEIGVEPSAALRDLQTRILRSDPELACPAWRPAAVVSGPGRTPRQLPLDVPTFVGRERELAALRPLLVPDGSTERAPVVVIHGPPGAGKSAFAVRAAHQWLTAFSAGQLYLNLHGATAGADPLAPLEGLSRLLRTLGVPAAEMPVGVEEAAALYRTLLAGRRMLILLDDAASEAQVRPLLPGGSSATVLVTSRGTLAGLAGSDHLALGPLVPGDAHDMLQRLLGNARTAAEPAACRRLAELCDHLPLALQVAAARLRARPAWTLAGLVDRLSDERRRLTELAAGDLGVRSSLNVSHAALRHHDQLDRDAASALVRLGLVHVTELDAPLVAALLDTSVTEVDPILERLLAAHLVEAVDSDRYRMHDLIRLFAREQAAAIPAAESTAAVTRVLRALLAAAVHATRLAYPRRTHYPAPERLEPTRQFAGPDDAGGWLEAASPQLIAMIRQSWAGPAEHVRLGLELTLALHWFLVLCSHSQDSVELNGHAVETAIQLGDRGAEAFARGALAFGLRETGRVPESTRQVRIELSICQEIGDRFGEQRASGNLGMSLLIEDRVEEAVGCLEHQRAVAREIDAPVGETYALLLLGRAYHMLGRHGDAIASLEAALAWCDEVGDDYLAGPALERLGLVRLDLGHVDLAREALQSSIERLGRSGYHLLRAEALISFACLWRRSGATGKALDCADAALEITEALGVYETSRQARAERTAALTAGS